MQLNVPTDIAEIKVRGDRIGVSLKTLARRTGVDATTLYRAARGLGDNRSRTLKAIAEALVYDEKALLAHLIALHPAAAMAALCPERKTA